MTQNLLRRGAVTVGRTVLASLVVLLTLPTGVGPAVGGWLAGRGTDRLHRGLSLSAVAGIVGALPWAVVVFLATSGAIEPIGYHDHPVHVGVMTAAPETFVFWQELGLTMIFIGTVAAMTVAGGVLAVLTDDVCKHLRGGVSSSDAAE